MPLADASLYGLRAGLPPDREAEGAPRLFWQALTPLGAALAAGLASAALSVATYVNHGRWVVECPDCPGAQLASRADRRFLCNYCGNAAIGGLWRPVVWPKAVSSIEAELEKRPTRSANWLPGETVSELRAETDANGVG